MSTLEGIGRWLVLAGIVIAILGGVLWLLGRLKILDRLPGTLRFELGGVTCVIPVLASIVLSILLTMVLNLILRNINR